MESKYIIKKDIQLQAEYYYELTVLAMDIYNKYKLRSNIDEKSDADGFQTFIYSIFIFDQCRFIYDVLEFYKIYFKYEYTQIITFLGDKYYHFIKKIRNNMHLYNKRKSYKNKANSIINQELEKFDMLEEDIFYFLRNDIAVYYYADDNSNILLGSNYFYYHYTKEVDLSGEEIKELSYKVISIIIKIADVLIENHFLVGDINYNISLYDRKSSEILSKKDIDKFTNFRLLLCLTQAGGCKILFSKILNKKTIYQSYENIWFFTQYLSIKYDEIFDNIKNLLRYSESKEILRRIFNNSNFITNDSYKKIISKLRNTVHYNCDEIIEGKNICDSFLTSENLFIDDLKNIFKYMEHNLDELINVLQYLDE